MRGRLLLTVLGCVAWVPDGATASAAQAVPTPRTARPAARIGASPTAPCVTVTVADIEAGSAAACAAQRLGEAARRAQDRAVSPMDAGIVSATSDDVRTGVANQAATRQRMGSSFGTGVQPQRPSPPVYAPPLSPKP